jgi:type II secretory pathway pseudopilin PulG
MKKTFTLIETIVVVAVIGLTLPVLFAIIFTLMRQQVKIYRLSQVKREGDYLISIMNTTIKNRAVSIYKSNILSDANIVCEGAGSSYSSPLYFLDEDQQFFGYEIDGNKVASTSAYPNVNLTSNKTIVSGLSIDCLRNTIYSPPSVLISFTIQYNTISTRPEETSSLYYQTRIKLRGH